jgi:uncharacterized DUF497 family protein
MQLVVYAEIEEKLSRKHQVTILEVEQAFLNRTGELAKENRPQHTGRDPRYWFISETDTGRRLKVVFVDDRTEPAPVIITAYEPNNSEEEEYARLQTEERSGTP